MPNSYVANSTSQEAIDEAIEAYLKKLAVDFENRLQAKFMGPKTGRVYGKSAAVKALARFQAGKRKTRPSGVHRASAPGEAPAIRSGALRKSIAYKIAKEGGVWALLIGVTQQSGRLKVAQALEFGTATIKPRPAWRPTLAEWKAALPEPG